MLADTVLTCKGIFFLFPIILVLWFLIPYLTCPLRGTPGPFIAGWTNLWRMLHVSRGKYHKVIQGLHEKYGPVVRIGPNVLSLNYPSLVKVIYNTKDNYRKTEFYHGSSAKANGKIIYNLFSECNPKNHAREKQPIGKYYTMTSARLFEPQIDETIGYLCRQLEDRFLGNDRKACELDEWILLYAWDVVGNVTFSESLGYLEKGYDYNNTIRTSETAMDYFCLVGQMPWLDHLLDKNPVYRIGPPSFGAITAYSIQKLIGRLQGQGKEATSPGLGASDFLDNFIEAKEKYPDTVDDTQIVSYLMINMIAGADTTAITLIAIFYFLLKNPSAWKRLQAEIPAQSLDSTTSHIPPYSDSERIPYLRAVVHEAMRLHPAVSMPLERYVPEGGLTLPNGQYVPPGCIIGIDPYTLGRNPSVWGEDAEIFRPERWLRDDRRESEEEYQARLRFMKNSDLSFGAGSRVCIGKNLALVQVFKVVATLVARYDISLAHPDNDWGTHNSFFCRQKDVWVTIRPRQE